MQIAPSATEQLTPFSIPTGDALLLDNGEFRSKFNRQDFMFDHGLAHHPLFELSALAKLAARIPKFKDFVYWQNGRVKVDDNWAANPAPRLTLEETIDGMAHNDSLVILKHAEQDPIYGPLLQEILQRIYSFTSPSAQQDIVLGESLIFINSPGRKTPYHMDMESNFLLQIAGVKFVHIFDCNDRTITPHTELESHCCGNHSSVVYKPERQGDAHYYHLTAGHGVHFPSLGPHWVQNGDELSVSININYDLVSVHQRLKRIYRVNQMLRGVGLTPSAPGVSPVRDAVKEKFSAGMHALLKPFRSAAARREEVEAKSYPNWRPVRHGN